MLQYTNTKEDTSTKKLFVLSYGNRRFEACRKLGWKTIPSYIGQDTLTSIPIDLIEVRDNTRLRINDSDIASLMHNIKQHGLLQPIGVVPSEEYDEDTFIDKNISENVHRKDITPLELSKAVNRLVKKGYSYSEIAQRFSMSVAKIMSVKDITSRVPERYQKHLVFNQDRNSNVAGFSVTNANVIAHARIPTKAREELMEYAFKNNISVGELRTILDFMWMHKLDVKQAIEKTKECTLSYIRVTYNREVFERENKVHGLSLQVYIQKVLNKELPLNPDIFK